MKFEEWLFINSQEIFIIEIPFLDYHAGVTRLGWVMRFRGVEVWADTWDEGLKELFELTSAETR